MRKNRTYAIAWARAISGRISNREEFISYLSLASEKELMERVTRKLGIRQQFDTVDFEMKNYIGTTTLNMALISDMAAPHLRSLQIHNIKSAIEKKYAGYKTLDKDRMYMFDGNVLLEPQIKKIFESESIERIRTGEPWIDELFVKMRRVVGDNPDIGIINLYLDRERAAFISKFRQLGAMAKFEVDAYNLKVDIILGKSKPELSEALLLSAGSKSESNTILTLQKKYNLQVEFMDVDSFIEKARHKLAVNNMVKFDESNIYSVLQMLLSFEKNIINIKESIKQKINRNISLKIID